MNKLKERESFIIIIATFLLFYVIPFNGGLSTNPIWSGLSLLHEYAHEHVLTCLVPAFFIAGAISVLIKKEFVLKYLGDEANKYISYAVASVSGSILAVCSCTILPIFAGIRKRGAGLGPAITFLFSGPAINIAAMFLTISVLGLNIGIARIIAAISISILAGVSMQLIFREETKKGKMFLEEQKSINVSKGIMSLFFLSLIGILIVNGLTIMSSVKYSLIFALILVIAYIAIAKFPKVARNEWLTETWFFAKLLLPVLFLGVFIAGFIMPFIPQRIIESLVGNNTIVSNVVASIFGAFMYFSTLTEIPILQALLAKGMHEGPALALLLAGPSLSLPNMLVIRKVLGNGKTGVYVLLVIIYATIAGYGYGAML